MSMSATRLGRDEDDPKSVAVPSFRCRRAVVQYSTVAFSRDKVDESDSSLRTSDM
jgi:hypothetical protein